MIDNQRTLEIYGYVSDTLSKGSQKRIVRVCDECGRCDEIVFQSYNKAKYPDLCNSCSKSGKNHCWYGRHHTEESKKKMSESGKIKIFTDEHRKNISNSLSGENHYLFGKIGKLSPMFGKHHSDETKKKIGDAQRGELNHRFGKIWDDEWKRNHSKAMKGKRTGKDNPMYGKRGAETPNWKGGFAGDRSHVKHECDCIKLNSRFKGSEGHHIMSGVIVYIPRDLHNRKYGIWHDLKNNKNMNEINKLAYKYLMGDY